MSIVQVLGASAGVLGALAVVLSAIFNRRQGGESFAHTELVDTLEVQRERIADLGRRLDQAEAAERQCKKDVDQMRDHFTAKIEKQQRTIDGLLTAMAKERRQ